MLARLVAYFDEPLLAHHVDRQLDQVADHRLHVAADVPDLGELGGFDLDERRLGQPRQPAGNLRLAHAGRSNHQDVLGRHFLRQVARQLLAPHAIPQGDGDRAFRAHLPDNVTVELRHDLPRRQGISAGQGGFGKMDGHGRPAEKSATVVNYNSSIVTLAFV